MKSPIVKHSVIICGHKTSISLEHAFWHSLKEIARIRSVTISDLLTEIDATRAHGNLSSALRLFVLDYYWSRSQDGHGQSHSENPESLADTSAGRVPLPQAP
jgi:predicted DNA-binding ribbon-helix-helix protein